MLRNPTVIRYLDRYRREHRKLGTRLTHYVGIPMIVASLPLIPTVPPVGVGMFAAGWGLQILGHRIEGNRPAFLRDPIYLTIGPLWVALELAEAVTGRALVPPLSPGEGAASA